MKSIVEEAEIYFIPKYLSKDIADKYFQDLNNGQFRIQPLYFRNRKDPSIIDKVGGSRPLPNYSLRDGILRSAITNPCLSKIVTILKWNLSFSFGDFSSFSSEIETKSVLFYAPERAGDNFHSFDLIQPPILPKGTANPLLMEQKTITTRFGRIACVLAIK